MATMRDVIKWSRRGWFFGGYEYENKKEAIKAVRYHNKIMRMPIGSNKLGEN